jgi:predicted ATP-grasp superfamily ATP-dependent carboligase
MFNILFTGGRAPATLELARAFHRSGHTVFMAESLRGHLSEPSNTITKNFLVPPPRQRTSAFINALKTIITENKIDLLIPTCEEAFYVAMGRGQFPCAVFVEPIEKLNLIHNKWAFVLKAIEYDLSIPETILVANQDDLLHAFAHWRELVIKPIYSRFATRTLILPTLKQALSTLTFESPWIAQSYVEGTQICTYSVVHNGHITAHAAYRSDFTAGQGATIVFQHIDHQAVFNWVEKFVEANQFTGQIAFDFMETPDGQIFALECNPRATSGIHLLASSPQFTESFFNSSQDCITPSGNESYMLSSAMLIYGLPASMLNGKIGRWFSTFFSSNDVIFNTRDIKPFLLQFRSIFSYLKLARQNHFTALEASTFDIEWNGEAKTTPRAK